MASKMLDDARDMMRRSRRRRNLTRKERAVGSQEKSEINSLRLTAPAGVLSSGTARHSSSRLIRRTTRPVPFWLRQTKPPTPCLKY